jgi:hypothetical protein
MTTTAVKRLLVTATVSAATVMITMTGPGAHAVSLSSDLTCEGTEALSLSPGLTNIQRDTTITGTALLNDCFSPASTDSDIVSGKATISATGSNGCSQTGNESGTVIFTWYSGPHQTGNEVGSTTVPYILSEHPDLTDNEIANEQKGSATLASTRLALDNMTGSFKLTGTAGGCTAIGINELTADIGVDFAPVL